MNNKPRGLAWQLLTDHRLYSARTEIQKSVQDLLAECADRLNEEIRSHNWLPEDAAGSKAKITRGDNYLNKPWMVLDFPRVFEKESVFAFRTMVLFGDAVHCTFHLSGRFLQLYSLTPAISVSIPGLKICNEGSPWVHHVTAEVFRDINHDSLHASHGFLKFGHAISFEEWENMSLRVTEVFRNISSILQR